MKWSTTLTPKIVFCYFCDADRGMSHRAGVALQVEGQIQKAGVLLVAPPGLPTLCLSLQIQATPQTMVCTQRKFSEFIVSTLGIAGLCN